VTKLIARSLWVGSLNLGSPVVDQTTMTTPGVSHPSPTTVAPGQVLTLPGAAPIKPRPELYKVNKGDTLSGIAAKKLGDANRWPEIARLNRDIVPDPDEIVLGQVLVILKR
jgi:LysM repeat protein